MSDDGERLYMKIREIVLSLPGVVEGPKFGMPGWFIGKRFFAHCHASKDVVYLEARLDKDEVKGHPPSGVMPHPQFAGYGWTRLVIRTEADLGKAEALLKKSHTYMLMTTVRRVWLPRQENLREKIRELNKRTPGVLLQVKPRREERKCVLW